MTTSYPTEVHLDDQWVPLQPSRMDCGIRVDRRRGGRAGQVPQVRRAIDSGRAARHPRQPTGARARAQRLRVHVSEVSSEKPKRAIIARLPTRCGGSARPGRRSSWWAARRWSTPGPCPPSWRPSRPATSTGFCRQRLACMTSRMPSAFSLGVNLERALAAEEARTTCAPSTDRRQAGGIREAVEGRAAKWDHARLRASRRRVRAGRLDPR